MPKEDKVVKGQVDKVVVKGQRDKVMVMVKEGQGGDKAVARRRVMGKPLMRMHERDHDQNQLQDPNQPM